MASARAGAARLLSSRVRLCGVATAAEEGVAVAVPGARRAVGPHAGINEYTPGQPD